MQLKPFALALSAALIPALASASSHREAPFISTMPTVDGSDFYMFNSYEVGRAGYVTILANYNPLQDPGNGPIFAPLNHEAVYDINIDNKGGRETRYRRPIPVHQCLPEHYGSSRDD